MILQALIHAPSDCTDWYGADDRVTETDTATGKLLVVREHTDHSNLASIENVSFAVSAREQSTFHFYAHTHARSHFYTVGMRCNFSAMTMCAMWLDVLEWTELCVYRYSIRCWERTLNMRPYSAQSVGQLSNWILKGDSVIRVVWNFKRKILGRFSWIFPQYPEKWRN